MARDMQQRVTCGDSTKFAWEDVDVVITDPPYRQAVHDRATSQSKVRGARHRDMGFGHVTDPLRRWTCWQATHARRWIVIFSDLESITLWKDGLEAEGATYVRTIPWVRWSMPQLSGDRPPQGAEAVIVAWGGQKGRKSWNGPGNLTHFDQKCLRGEDKHRAEKPLDLALALVQYFSDPGEVVADPFAGAGTFGLACKLLRRGYEGCELDPEWAERAANRIGLSKLSSRDQERWDRWHARAHYAGTAAALGA